MTVTQLWGALIIFLICPIIGGIPLIDWITYGLSGKELKKLGTGNVSVSAAFYHGGKLIGILAAISEAAKGISVILITRKFFPPQSAWEILALIALVMGRYWWAKGAGVTNVTWGIMTHNPIGAILIFLIGGISFTIFREKKSARLAVLGLMVVILGLQKPHNLEYLLAVISLAFLLGWIYTQIPDDLNLSSNQVNSESAKVFRFFSGNKGILTLNNNLESDKVGGKAASLAQLKKWGYSVPDGWILQPGDDIENLLKTIESSQCYPVAVRSSALDEDSETSSAAGIYASFLNINDSESLKIAIFDCLASYNTPIAKEYRRQRQEEEKSMVIIIQKQIQGLFSGVAFSRNPVNQLEDCVCIEALPGEGIKVVSGQLTPYEYKVYFPEERIEGKRKKSISENIILNMAKIAREIENLSHGVPQDIEWSYDGETLWILQTRSITTLQPLWTRKIAAEVIPGVIRPLTWSINQPLTCGVWGEIFAIALGKKADNLNFNQTATLHYHRAYFNATLLGKIFRLMGLPAESLEFLTRGAKFSKPPIKTTIQNLSGLWRLLVREWQLEQDFSQDYDRHFAPLLDELIDIPPQELSASELLNRIDNILDVLKKATYYSILAPLSFAFRQAFLKVNPEDLDNSKTPEISALNSLEKIALETRNLLPMEQLKSECDSCASLFAYLAEITDSDSILERFNKWLENHGYLSETATDISVPRWQEDTHIVREMFTQFIFQNEQSQRKKSAEEKENHAFASNSIWLEVVQKRLNLKGKVTEIYSKLLANLRYTFLALESQWLEANLLGNEGDIFFLKLDEIRKFVDNSDSETNLMELIQNRKFQWEENSQIKSVPYLIYGNPPSTTFIPTSAVLSPERRLNGIGASVGIIEGKVKVLLSLSERINVDRNTVLVVPFTDSGWSPVLAQAGGLITEVGGRLSHGAIIAREYGIPAVMDINYATQLLQDGQTVRVDGQKGIVEVLN